MASIVNPSDLITRSPVNHKKVSGRTSAMRTPAAVQRGKSEETPSQSAAKWGGIGADEAAEGTKAAAVERLYVCECER